MVPVSIRTTYGTGCPPTTAVARSAGRWAGSASGTKAPAVFLYWYVTTVGAEQSGWLAGARPKAVVSQKNGCCCGPENTGPVIGWSTIRSAATRPADAATT